MSDPFAIYPRPDDGPEFPLAKAPRLESWDRAGHPSQVLLTEYLAHVQELIGERLQSFSEPLALLLSVGLPAGTDLLTGGRDLDNYLYPVVRSLGWDRFVSVYGEKRHSQSSVRVEPAGEPDVRPEGTWSFASATTTASSVTAVWKQQVWDQVARRVPRPADGGPLEVHICFRVSARRNWAYLWKPALDSLGSIFGEDARGKPFHPQDDRVIRLGLHRVVDDELGNQIELGVWWRSLSVSPRVLGPRFDDALVYATRLHAAQARKGTDIPYVSHLLAVSARVIEDGGSEDEAIAALLHDAVEDQGGTAQLERIHAQFGDRVATIVAGCSDSFDDPKPPWEERKQGYIHHLSREEDEGVLRVSLADKLHNASAILRDLRLMGPKIWERFNAGSDEQLWYYESLLEIFRPRLQSPMVSELEEVVREIGQIVKNTE